LKLQGYSTACISANPFYLSPMVGLGQGIDSFHSKFEFYEDINRRVFARLDTRPKDQPFFLVINYMDAHFPYNNEPNPRVTMERPPGTRDLIKQLRRDMFTVDAPGAPPDRLEEFRLRYALGTANADDGIAELFAGLTSRGLFEDAHMVVCADHGEALGEHGYIAHAKDVYQHQLHVPVIVKPPGIHTRGGTMHDAAVSLAAMPHWLSEPLPNAARAQVLEAFPYTPASAPVLAEQYYSLWLLLKEPDIRPRFDRVRLSITEGPAKFIHSSDGKHELYDLSADPAELTNRYETDESVAGTHTAGALRTRLEAFREANPSPIPEPVASPGLGQELSPELQESLDAIGYQ